jgi:hypothetical protein
MEVKYLVKGDDCKLNRIQTQENSIKWKGNTRRRMRERKKKNRLKKFSCDPGAVVCG